MEEIYEIWFSNLDIKNISKLQLFKKYSAKQIYELNFEDLVRQNIEEKVIVKILQNRSLEEAKRVRDYMQAKKVQLISCKNEKYPHKLQHISDKPAFLYIRGNEAILDEDSVAIVGCRMATTTGKTLARMIAKSLANRNIHIVSGLAIGIDKYAHLGALDSEIGKTVAVLGCGLADEEVYPYQNKRIFERILEKGGAIISEYGIGSKPEAKHFPARNRIISGISDKVIVVEAKKRSGSLITVDWALEQGRDVFAVPRQYSFSKFNWYE